jgi:hypothetical protein
MASDSASPSEEQIALISGAIRGIPDFPKPGILFWDVTTLLLNPEAFRCCIDLLAARYAGKSIGVVAGALLCAREGRRVTTTRQGHAMRLQSAHCNG